MGCTAGTLTPTSKTQDAQDYANYLIGELIKTGSGTPAPSSPRA
jgi:hypothetical protein